MGFAVVPQIGPAGPAGANGSGLTTDFQRFDPELGEVLSAGSFPQYLKVDGTNFPVSLLAFDETTVETVFYKFTPSNYTSGNLTLDIYWYAASATSGNVVWGGAIAAITAGDAQSVETKAFATQSTATSGANGTAKGLNKATVTISNLDSIASGDIVWLQLQRVANSGSDTMAGDAYMVYAQITWSIA